MARVLQKELWPEIAGIEWTYTGVGWDSAGEPVPETEEVDTTWDLVTLTGHLQPLSPNKFIREVKLLRKVC